MKTLEEAKKRFLLEADYASKEERIDKQAYSGLSKDEQKKYTEFAGANGTQYYQDNAYIPEHSNAELEEMWKYAMYSKLNQINTNVDIIKKCTVLFAVLTIISLIISLVMAIMIGSFFSALPDMFKLMTKF